MSLQLPYALVEEMPDVQANFEALAAITLNQLGIARGVASLTFSATNQMSVSVSHGLGGVPTSVVATLSTNTVTGPVDIRTLAFARTTFSLLVTFPSSFTGTQTISWVAVL